MKLYDVWDHLKILQQRGKGVCMESVKETRHQRLKIVEAVIYYIILSTICIFEKVHNQRFKIYIGRKSWGKNILFGNLF